MNLKDFYSQPQAMDVLGLKYRMQIKRWREDHSPYLLLLCGKPFYLRMEVDTFVENIIRAHPLDSLRFRFEDARLRAVRYDLDLDEWLPRCRALETWPWSHEMLYALSGVRTALPIIRTRRAYGQHFFSWEDMDRQIKKQS